MKQYLILKHSQSNVPECSLCVDFAPVDKIGNLLYMKTTASCPKGFDLAGTNLG